MQAFKILINGPQVTDLLRLKRRMFFQGSETKKIRIDDEDDILEEVLVYYKHPSLDPNIPIRIAFKCQPAIDTGGVTRQFFTDSLLLAELFQCLLGRKNDFDLLIVPKFCP